MNAHAPISTSRRSPQHCIQVALNAANLYEALTAPQSEERATLYPRLGQTGKYVHTFAVGQDDYVLVDCVGFLNREDARSNIDQALETMNSTEITVCYLETQLCLGFDA